MHGHLHAKPCILHENANFTLAFFLAEQSCISNECLKMTTTHISRFGSALIILIKLYLTFKYRRMEDQCNF